jgi:cobalt-precorrin 5A hydrolase/precorrin-3B C17-methyltransferase
MTGPVAILILGADSLATARRIKVACPGAAIHGLKVRVEGADIAYGNFGVAIRDLYERGTPIVALCAAGIVIRALAPLLHSKRAEPPVLAVAEDGSAVVPLLGGLSGVNSLARDIGAALAVAPAITTAGELRFGACLLDPPPGYVLRNPAHGKTFISDLIAGNRVRICGDAPWLAGTQLPVDPDGRLAITVTPREIEPAQDELVFHPRAVVIGIAGEERDLAQSIAAVLAETGLARRAVACLVADARDIGRRDLHAAAKALNLPLRFLETADDEARAERLVRAVVPREPVHARGALALSVAATPVNPDTVGRARGRLAVLGLGPGDEDLVPPAVREELDRAEHVVGYDTYIRMAGPFRADQQVHASDNREEMARARHAFALAAAGRCVAIVSSGDPGVFAMAAAVMEALDGSRDPAWHAVEIAVLPGISAAMAAAAGSGAPLGHDFCVLSLSDNLKPWAVIERRLEHAAAADLVIALYNPASKARPQQFARALDILRQHRRAETPVVIGRDLFRPGEALTVTSLGAVHPDQADMRTVVIVGSSTTRSFARMEGGAWVYTPRRYGADGPQEAVLSEAAVKPAL